MLGLPTMSCNVLVAFLSLVVVVLTQGSGSEVSRINMAQLVLSSVAAVLVMVGPKVSLDKGSPVAQVASLLIGAGLVSLSVVGLGAVDNERRATEGNRDVRSTTTIVLSYLSSSIALVCALAVVAVSTDKVFGVKA